MRSSAFLILSLAPAAALQLRAPALRAPTASRAPLARGPSGATMLALPGVAALSPRVATALALNSGLAAFGTYRKQRTLTPMGLAHSWALGVMLWGSLGWRAWTTCVLYLIGGKVVTKAGWAKKEALGIAEGRGGMRGPENVWGSAATAAACALGCARYPHRAALLKVGFASALATKLSDTFASEIGKAYGKTTYLITSLKLVPAGTEGAVSAEGTAAGVVGSIVIATYAVACGLVPRSTLVPVLGAAVIGTTCESVIGAAAQDSFEWLTNEVVNFIMTVIGAAAGIGLAVALGAV